MAEVGIRSYVRKAPTAFSTSGLARRQRSVLLPPSSQDFGGWDELLGESMIAVGELDPLPRHSHMLSMDGERHRMRKKRQGGIIPDAACMKKLYRIAGQDYCRRYIVAAAVAAGVIAEVKPGVGPVVHRGVPSGEHGQPHLR